jgi:hypothetical protein
MRQELVGGRPPWAACCPFGEALRGETITPDDTRKPCVTLIGPNEGRLSDTTVPSTRLVTGPDQPASSRGDEKGEAS